MVLLASESLLALIAVGFDSVTFCFIIKSIMLWNSFANSALRVTSFVDYERILPLLFGIPLTIDGALALIVDLLRFCLTGTALFSWSGFESRHLSRSA